MKSVHPFPARMAPDIALEHLRRLQTGSRVLDPMTGSGTVLRQAIDLGHKAIGFDVDPLAVLMSNVWTTPVDDADIEGEMDRLLRDIKKHQPHEISLPWIDNVPDTAAFVDFWFGEKQRADLRRIAFLLERYESRRRLKPGVLNVLRLALSRIIITKENNASLARDTSHSRPHKVCEASDFEVLPAFERSVRFLRNRLMDFPPRSAANVTLGDARCLDLENGSVDAVLTSPPYLNAIDYLRGHRMALVWLGRTFTELRLIRSNSIGAERAPNDRNGAGLFDEIRDAMGQFDTMSRRHAAMIERYSEDIYRMVSEVSRVLCRGGTATFVVGNSCLKGVFVHNAAGVAAAARMMGLSHVHTVERDLPDNKRYLPITLDGNLSKRMRSETVCTFAKC